MSDAIEIICKIHDDQKRIIKVGIKSGKKYKVDVVAKWIINKKYSFCTGKGGKKVPVYGRKHPKTKRYFLTTIKDGKLENNLDFLPDCE